MLQNFRKLLGILTFGFLSAAALDATAQQDIAQRLANDIKTVPGVRDVKVRDARTLVIIDAVRKENLLNLDNLMNQLSVAPRDKQENVYQYYLSGYSRSLKQVLEGRPIPNIKVAIPLIRSKSYADDVAPMTASLTNFLGGLYIVIGENLSDTIGSISKKDLEDMKVDLSELNRAAYAYIDTLSESATIEASNIFRTRLDGDLDSSLMLSEKFRKRAVESAGGPVLFGIPFSGDLYFVKADDAAAARLLSQFVRELFSRGQGPRPLTARLFWSDGPILRER